MTRLSVVIPTKNRPRLLRRALGSFVDAASQLEVIVVDDGSSPDDAELNQAASAGLPGCRYLHLPPPSRGAPAARNHGFRLSRGAYVWFMDDDDYAPAATVADVLRAIGVGSRAEILLMPRELVLDDVPVERRVPVEEADKLERYRRFGTEVTTSCAVFSRTVIEQLSGWDEALLALQDTDLFLRAAAIARFACLRTEPVRVDMGAPGRITYAFLDSQIGKLQFLRKHWRQLPARRRLRYIGQILMCTPLLRAARRRRLAAARRRGAGLDRSLANGPPP